MSTELSKNAMKKMLSAEKRLGSIEEWLKRNIGVKSIRDVAMSLDTSAIVATEILMFYNLHDEFVKSSKERSLRSFQSKRAKP